MNYKNLIVGPTIATLAFLGGLTVHYGLTSIGQYSGPEQLERIEEPFANVDARTDPGRSLDPGQVSVTAEINTVVDFDPTGEYYLWEEKLPIAFKDFEYLAIQTHSYNAKSDSGNDGEGWNPIPPMGSLRANREYKFKVVSVSPVYLSFETETKNGISYKFLGRFDHQNDGSESEHSMGGITGKLEKVKNGVVVSMIEAIFYPGGC